MAPWGWGRFTAGSLELRAARKLLLDPFGEPDLIWYRNRDKVQKGTTLLPTPYLALGTGPMGMIELTPLPLFPGAWQMLVEPLIQGCKAHTTWHPILSVFIPLTHNEHSAGWHWQALNQ